MHPQVKVLCALIFAFSSWFINAAKLGSCDFKAGFKCELMHGLGVAVPPLAIVTVWFGGDSE